MPSSPWAFDPFNLMSVKSSYLSSNPIRALASMAYPLPCWRLLVLSLPFLFVPLLMHQYPLVQFHLSERKLWWSPCTKVAQKMHSQIAGLYLPPPCNQSSLRGSNQGPGDFPSPGPHSAVPWQSGFWPGHSTTTTLLHVTNEWYSSLDRGFVVGAVFIDIAKAFDTVNHTLLLPVLPTLDLILLRVSGP